MISNCGKCRVIALRNPHPKSDAANSPSGSDVIVLKVPSPRQQAFQSNPQTQKSVLLISVHPSQVGAGIRRNFH